MKSKTIIFIIGLIFLGPGYHVFSEIERDGVMKETMKNSMQEKMSRKMDKKNPADPKDTDRISSSWSRPADAQIRKKLTPMQYKVTQENGTEPPFHNAYWDNKKEGIYVDIVSGEPLFSSTDKFESGTGWPSFTKPIESDRIVEKEDKSLFMTRTEVRSRKADSHLGHVFNDGPAPGGLRYCINSAALQFIPKKNLEAKGYGRYLKLF